MQSHISLSCSRVCKAVRPQRCSNARRDINRRRVNVLCDSSMNDANTAAATTALSVTAGAAASALLAKVTALIAAAGATPGALANLPSSAKSSENIYFYAACDQRALAEKVLQAPAPCPAVSTNSSPALPRHWLFVDTAAEWLALNRQATTAGCLLATVFISDAAARVHGPMLERLRRSYSTGPSAPVRFVFVHVGPGYEQRNRACAACTAAAPARGSQGLTLARLSATANLHGLDVALSSLLPDGIRAFPSLLLTGGVPGPDGSRQHWVAATRVSELTQLVADGVFINNRAKLAAAAAAGATTTQAPPAMEAAARMEAVVGAAAATSRDGRAGRRAPGGAGAAVVKDRGLSRAGSALVAV